LKNGTHKPYCMNGVDTMDKFYLLTLQKEGNFSVFNKVTCGQSPAEYLYWAKDDIKLVFAIEINVDEYNKLS
jgi:hypothetical protein